MRAEYSTPAQESDKATHTNDTINSPNEIHRNSSSGRVKRSAPVPPRAVARFHAVANTAIARTAPFAANRVNPAADAW